MNHDVTSFSAEYKKFLALAKTERLCVREIASRLETAGFVPIEGLTHLVPGDRIYRLTKKRTIIAAVVGRNGEKFRLVGSHVDSPKLDLKPEPFFSAGRLALMKLHDYGWIKPYQWVNVPLELRGIIFTRDGNEVEFALGENDSGPVFTIPDIPPHVAGSQMKETMESGFNVSQLNAVAGTGSAEAVLDLLKSRYGIGKDDFACADLCLVPHQKPVDVGFDGELIGGYGQDDRAPVFASLIALIETGIPNQTAVAFFVDKEEVASTGDTSAQSFVLRNFASAYARLIAVRGCDADSLLEGAESISADVTTGFDPNFAEKFDETNIAYIGGGIAVEKYGAAGAGKFRASEASAEYMQVVRCILETEGIPWQTGTLAKLGVGGGGTIAAFLSRYGMDCVDAGPCLLGMHSPFEVGSKKDFFSSYRFYRGFFNS